MGIVLQVSEIEAVASAPVWLVQAPTAGSIGGLGYATSHSSHFLMDDQRRTWDDAEKLWNEKYNSLGLPENDPSVQAHYIYSQPPNLQQLGTPCYYDVTSHETTTFSRQLYTSKYSLTHHNHNVHRCLFPMSLTC